MIFSDSMETKFAKGCLMVNSSVELSNCAQQVADIVNENMQEIEDPLFRAIKKGQELGKFTTAHTARALARYIFDTISGLHVAAKSGVEKMLLMMWLRLPYPPCRKNKLFSITRSASYFIPAGCR